MRKLHFVQNITKKLTVRILEANDSPVPRPMAVHARKAVPGKVRSGNDGRATGRSATGAIVTFKTDFHSRECL